MKHFVLVVLALSMLSTACRTTHEASDEELGTLQTVGGSITSTGDVGADNGQSSIGVIYATYPIFQALADKDQTSGSLSYPMTAEDSKEGRFISRMRASWPDCLIEGDGRVEYDQCDYSASGNAAEISFLLDGFYEWTDSSSSSDLLFDLSVGGSGFSAGTTLAWSGASAWTETTYDGDFNLAFDVTAEVLGLGIPGVGVSFAVDAMFETLTWDEACDKGPTFGIMDWKSVYREGTEPPQNRHVTVEYLECGVANITW